jgi:hypothetical protein
VPILRLSNFLQRDSFAFAVSDALFPSRGKRDVRSRNNLQGVKNRSICELATHGQVARPSMMLSRTRVNEAWAGLPRNLDESMSSTVIRNRRPKLWRGKRSKFYLAPFAEIISLSNA